jgi:hypothetical protein
VRSLQLAQPGDAERRLAGALELRDLGFRFSSTTVLV